jgi:hypothetical protein
MAVNLSLPCKTAGIMVFLAALLTFRAVWVEPRAVGALCAGAAPWWPCALRAALLWGQYWGLWGGSALVLGVLANRGVPVAALAIALGAAGVVNYNATFGMLGLALGAWAWIIPPAPAATAAAPPAPGRIRST